MSSFIERSFFDELHKLLFGVYPAPKSMSELALFEMERVSSMSLKDRVDYLADIHGVEIYKEFEEIMALNEDIRIEYEKG